mmetsp:Transcript_147686/g.258206  ORF Transcript_147686/g.258206 Transcript_147686/m.258206 type:complete len:646 (+) Transcript_147686:145-2082(+)
MALTVQSDPWPAPLAGSEQAAGWWTGRRWVGPCGDRGSDSPSTDGTAAGLAGGHVGKRAAQAGVARAGAEALRPLWAPRPAVPLQLVTAGLSLSVLHGRHEWVGRLLLPLGLLIGGGGLARGLHTRLLFLCLLLLLRRLLFGDLALPLLPLLLPPLLVCLPLGVLFLLQLTVPLLCLKLFLGLWHVRVLGLGGLGLGLGLLLFHCHLLLHLRRLGLEPGSLLFLNKLVEALLIVFLNEVGKARDRLRRALQQLVADVPPDLLLVEGSNHELPPLLLGVHEHHCRRVACCPHPLSDGLLLGGIHPHKAHFGAPLLRPLPGLLQCSEVVLVIALTRVQKGDEGDAPLVQHLRPPVLRAVDTNGGVQIAQLLQPLLLLLLLLLLFELLLFDLFRFLLSPHLLTHEPFLTECVSLQKPANGGKAETCAIIPQDLTVLEHQQGWGLLDPKLGLDLIRILRPHPVLPEGQAPKEVDGQALVDRRCGLLGVEQHHPGRVLIHADTRCGEEAVRPCRQLRKGQSWNAELGESADRPAGNLVHVERSSLLRVGDRLDPPRSKLIEGGNAGGQRDDHRQLFLLDPGLLRELGPEGLLSSSLMAVDGPHFDDSMQFGGQGLQHVSEVPGPLRIAGAVQPDDPHIFVGRVNLPVCLV